MADTQRTRSDLLTALFQDGQSAGAITPQDLRDFIVSVAPENGGMYISTPAATTIGTAGTFVKAEGTTTALSLTSGMTMPSTNRIQYDAAAAGLPDKVGMINVSCSMTCASSNQNISLALAKNGTVIAATTINRFVSTGSDEGAVSITASVEMSSTDYVEVWITNNTSTGSVTLTKMVFTARGSIP